MSNFMQYYSFRMSKNTISWIISIHLFFPILSNSCKIGKNWITLPRIKTQIIMAIEKAPHIQHKALLSAMLSLADSPLAEQIEKINTSFEYWDTVKYKKCHSGYTSQQLWTSVKASRAKMQINVWKRYGINLSLTNAMQRMCHEFDINFGNTLAGGTPLDANNRQHYLMNSLMEEAIFSSQMEGAATTRKVAKEMLQKKMKPKDKSQQMICNNYQTIRFIVDHKEEDLTPELLLQIHALMTDKTMPSADDAGRFRSNDEVVVENGITHETVHIPPTYSEIPQFVDDLCQFFNERETKLFVHPIIRGIIIHFMISYVHPFVDGNGRTARALFYWYMMRQGYWLTEYLSISRVIAQSKKSYEKAFLYTEADHMDIGYFVNYHLRVLGQSYQQLLAYLKRKEAEKNAAQRFLLIGDINPRQAEIIKLFVDDAQTILTVQDVQTRFSISPTTAKADITKLMERGLLTEISFNKVKKGYVKGERFDESIP